MKRPLLALFLAFIVCNLNTMPLRIHNQLPVAIKAELTFKSDSADNSKKISLVIQPSQLFNARHAIRQTMEDFAWNGKVTITFYLRTDAGHIPIADVEFICSGRLAATDSAEAVAHRAALSVGVAAALPAYDQCDHKILVHPYELPGSHTTLYSACITPLGAAERSPLDRPAGVVQVPRAAPPHGFGDSPSTVAAPSRHSSAASSPCTGGAGALPRPPRDGGITPRKFWEAFMKEGVRTPSRTHTPSRSPYHYSGTPSAAARSTPLQAHPTPEQAPWFLRVSGEYTADVAGLPTLPSTLPQVWSNPAPPAHALVALDK